MEADIEENTKETSVNSNLNHSQNNEIDELTFDSSINVWGRNQQTLENQALHELEILTQEPSNNNDNNNKNIEIKTPALDIDSYLKRQEELRKIQEYKKSLKVSEKSRTIADKISKQQQERYRKKQKINETNEKRVKKLEKDGSDSEYIPTEDEDSDCAEIGTNKTRKRKRSNSKSTERIKDDGRLEYFKQRLEEYYKQLEEENCLKVADEDEDDVPECYTIKRGLKIPMRIWTNLYNYQQDGVRWLWKLHQETTGGILGDEMGLGKTVQIIAFLSGLEYTKIISLHERYKGLGPTLIVCPATVLHQWVQHFHNWAPEFRVAVLHQSGSYQGTKIKLIKEIHENNGILITTYQGILKYKDNLIELCWHYLILDEGHKIRNTNAKISIAVKQIRTPYRLMLTGSPMQNNLQELWSLFDFTNPGMLGNLNTFMEHFAQPIQHGGFVNATPMQEATALSVATTLKNLISPYLLRRCKNEVQEHINLPNKNEQVLFCSLTDQQKDLYKGYLMGDHVGTILGKDSKNWFSENQLRANVLVAITTLRKICNHPDIYLHEADLNDNNNNNKNNDDIQDDLFEDKFGYYKKSGKMIVVSALLKMWKKQKHRVLLFTQSRAMLTIFEEFLTQLDYKFMKMDGTTTISSRQPLINKFNEDKSYDVFLLTTRVGGIGVNLTGADRVIIYDPDWNPATDTQARERAWRIGQDKQVTIYRLLSSGTIEEKMYQRQVWKQLLSNKILVDPKTHRYFKSTNLYDLFSLPDDKCESNPESTNIFRDSRVRLQEKIRKRKEHKETKLQIINNDDVQFSEDKIQAMKNLAQQIARSLTTTSTSKEEQPINKTSYQLELEVERQKKLKQREELKKLTPAELMRLNRSKTELKEGEDCNKVDDMETNVSFSKALEYSEVTAKLYHDLKMDKKNSDDNNDDDGGDKNRNTKEKVKKKHKDVYKSVVDTSGRIEGEQVEGLVKTEVKKLRRKYEKLGKNTNQDQYVLEKLFSKKGISGALQHDTVVENKKKINSIKIDSAAKLQADLALQAIRKSHLNNWRW